MRQIDPQAEIVQLQEFGAEFEGLCGAVGSLTLAPGTDARQQLTSKILATNKLGRRTPAAAVPATGRAR
ncbi:hypothetical protein [Streptomyces sp. PSAA01]|uniref:hypothetical protein n=1 Tax=Streptomyces sp. PSAA01 TaxID=2912762 RepID=UPI001F3D7486|nr:hypothetical protein [Streptomyces sp. PSAA01]MCG0285436.1 hypothetical protein [Streptomyces sp. PSAA01]